MNDSIEWIKDEYRQRYLGSYDFIIAATSEPRTNDEVAKDAEQLGLLERCTLAMKQAASQKLARLYLGEGVIGHRPTTIRRGIRRSRHYHRSG